MLCMKSTASVADVKTAQLADRRAREDHARRASQASISSQASVGPIRMYVNDSTTGPNSVIQQVASPCSVKSNVRRGQPARRAAKQSAAAPAAAESWTASQTR